MNKNLAIATIAALILMISGAFIALSLNQENFVFPRNSIAAEAGIDDRRNGWYSDQLRAMGETNISASNSVIYRFTLLRSFHSPICVRVEATNGNQFLVATSLNGQAGYGSGDISKRTKISLSASQFARVESLFQRLQFSNLPPVGRSEGKDGARWIVESTKPTYKVVDYWSPETGPVRQIGTEMLELAGIVVPREDLY